MKAGDFLAPLSGERQKLDNRTIWTTDFSSGKDDLSELGIVQYPVSSDFLRRQGHAFGGRLIKHGLTHPPAQEVLERLQGLVSVARSPPPYHTRNDVNFI